MHKLHYKSILDGDKAPTFKKITTSKFIVKTVGDGQYTIYKDRIWNSLWHIRDDSHTDIGYGLDIKQAANVVLNNYVRKMYREWFLDAPDPSKELLGLQYKRIIDECVRTETMPSELSWHKQKFICHAYKKLNNYDNDEPRWDTLTKISEEVSTKIHCLETDCDGHDSYSQENDYD